MLAINSFLFISGVLLLLGISSSKFSDRLGMPVLVVFLGVGMLAGSEGLGGLAFENYDLAVGVGTAALALILFDGGLRTPWAAIRAGWKPALALSTAGVVLTALVTGLAAAWVLGLSPLHGILLGAIVGSTDAAAVFSVLRASRLKLPTRLEATLEIESGSNDPMAVFLTIGLLQFLGGEAASAAALTQLFVLQFGVGTVVGLGAGRAGAWVVNRMKLDAAGLYPLLAVAFGLLSFGLAAVLGGSGFLAVYLTGIVMGNASLAFRRNILLFHDAAAWLAQIVLFIMLGLLSSPSQLLAVAGPALAVAVVLVLVARPLSVLLTMAPFGFSAREQTFLSWVGLKGAVPITLATFPLLAGLPGSELLFNVVFFIVLVSAMTQGWTLPFVARRLGLVLPSDPEPPLRLEISALREVDGEIVEYVVTPVASCAGHTLREIPLPEGAVVALVVRGDEVVAPRGTTVLRPEDHVFVAARAALVPTIDRLFNPALAQSPPPEGLALVFSEEVRVGSIIAFLGLPLPAAPERTLGELADAESAPGLAPYRLRRDPVEPLVTLTLEATAPGPGGEEMVAVGASAEEGAENPGG